LFFFFFFFGNMTNYIQIRLIAVRFSQLSYIQAKRRVGYPTTLQLEPVLSLRVTYTKRQDRSNQEAYTELFLVPKPLGKMTKSSMQAMLRFPTMGISFSRHAPCYNKAAPPSSTARIPPGTFIGTAPLLDGTVDEAAAAD